MNQSQSLTPSSYKRQTRCKWVPETKECTMRDVYVGFFVPVLIVSGAYLFSFFYFDEQSHAGRSTENKNTPTLVSLPWKEATSAYFILKNPSDSLYTTLNKLASKGVSITLVTPVALPQNAESLGFTIFTAPVETIGAQGVLLDGYRWFPLETVTIDGY